MTNNHRRVPVTDLDLGITAGFINFNQSLPDVDIFKYNKDGKIETSRPRLADAGRV